MAGKKGPVYLLPPAHTPSAPPRRPSFILWEAPVSAVFSHLLPLPMPSNIRKAGTPSLTTTAAASFQLLPPLSLPPTTCR